MKNKKIAETLKEIRLPNKWRLFIAIHVLLALSFLFINSEFLLNINNIFMSSMSIIGVYAGYRYHKHQFNPWGLLLGGVTLISLSIILRGLIYFGLENDLLFITMIEEVGMVLVTLFAFISMFHIEREYNIHGFTIDYSLTVISLTLFILLQ